MFAFQSYGDTFVKDIIFSTFPAVRLCFKLPGGVGEGGGALP